MSDPNLPGGVRSHPPERRCAIDSWPYRPETVLPSSGRRSPGDRQCVKPGRGSRFVQERRLSPAPKTPTPAPHHGRVPHSARLGCGDGVDPLESTAVSKSTLGPDTAQSILNDLIRQQRLLRLRGAGRDLLDANRLGIIYWQELVDGERRAGTEHHAPSRDGSGRQGAATRSKRP
jgi:hypothetical protein